MSENPDRKVETNAFDALAATYWDSDDPVQTRLVSEALVKKATGLVGVGLHDEAIAALDEAIMRLVCSAGAKGELLSSAILGLAGALLAKAVVLLGEGRHQEGLEVLDNVIERFEDDLEPALRRAVALALRHKVTALVDSGDTGEAFEAREYMARHYGDEGVNVPELGGEIL